VHHRAVQIDHQTDATIFQFIILMFIYSSTCFGRSPAHHEELNDCSSSLWFYLRIVVTVVLCSWSARPRTRHDCHHDMKVKPEAATAIIDLLMMGGRTLRTCWAVNKHQDNKLKNCCIWLIYLNCGLSFFCKFLNHSDCRPGLSNCRCDAVLIFRVKCIFPVPLSLTFSYERRTSESELQPVTWEALMWHTIPSDVPSIVAEQ
jgi:hypothetical protein